jgi:alpha-L-rhamnosidase
MKRLEQEILVKKEGHVDTGIHGTYYLLKSLLGQNRNDLIYEMVAKRDYPGSGYMLDNGATTLWEQWDGQNSLLHSSFVSVGAWFLEGIAGIRLDPATPGYKHFFIRPAIVGDLRRAKGEYDSPYGTIRSEWKLSEGRLELAIDVPPNTSATVHIPTDDPKTVTESGRPATQSPEVRQTSSEAGIAIFEVTSGHYQFSAKKK